MKKSSAILATFVLISSAANTAFAIDASDYEGSYTCAKVVNATNYSNISNLDLDNWVGKKMTIRVNNSWGDTPNELSFCNMVPMEGYFTTYFYGEVNPTEGTAYLYTNRSIHRDGLTNYYAYSYKNGQYGDLTVTWNDDRSAITIENMALMNQSTGSLGFYCEKVIFESARIPNTPNVSPYFDVNIGKINVEVTAPTTYNYESNFANITEPLTKITLSRSADWGTTWEQLTSWENVEPGATVSYTDGNIEYDMDKYYQYKAEVFAGLASNSNTSGCQGGISSPDVTNLAAQVSANGKPEVTISFNLPSAEELVVPLTGVTIRRICYNFDDYYGEEEGVVVKTYDNPEDLVAGKAITFVDNTVELGNVYSYVVSTSWQYGYNWGENLEVFVGIDGPGYIDNIEATTNGKEVIIKWSAPTVGRNYGYFDPEATRYTVARYESEDVFDYDTYTYPTMVTLTPEEGIAETQWSDNLEASSAKKFTYIVYTFAEGYEPLNAAECEVMAGPKGTLPFTETFDVYKDEWSRGADYLWMHTAPTSSNTWANVTYSCYWGSDYRSQYALGDTNPNSWEGSSHPGGFLCVSYYSYFEPNDYCNYTSYAFDFSGVKNPVMSLYVLQMPSANTCYVDIHVDSPGHDELGSFGKIATYNPDLATAEWKKFFVPLTGAAELDDARINLLISNGATPTDGSPVAIDQIEIDDFPPVSDLAGTVTEDGILNLSWSDPSTATQDAISYDVYKDGVLISADQIELSYTEEADSNPHDYYVVARYEVGGILAPASNVAHVDGFSSLQGLNVASSLKVAGRKVFVDGNAAIYTIDGRELYRSTGKAEYNMQPGVYLINLNGKTHKAIVK